MKGSSSKKSTPIYIVELGMHRGLQVVTGAGLAQQLHLELPPPPHLKSPKALRIVRLRFRFLEVQL